MATIIPYRNSHGYLISKKKPIYIAGEVRTYNTGGFYSIANLIWCPEREGLCWIGHCEKCELFAGHVQYRGVLCRTTKPNTPPIYLNRSK